MADSDSFTDSWHPDAAGWVLGVLDPEESGQFEVHLESCPECRQAVAELEATAQMLKTAVGLPDVQLADGPEPPADLEARTLARVQQAARKSARRRWSPRRTLVAAVAVAVVAATATAIPILASSAPALAFTYTLQSPHGTATSGQAVAHQTGDGWSVTLTVHGLPKPGPGQFYECWYAGPGNRPGHPDLITAGTFTVSSVGTATVQMWSAADPRAFPFMEITTETAGDAQQHGQALLSGNAQ